MRRLKHFGAVLAARNREFIRDRSSWAWSVIFPVFLVVGLAVVFGGPERPLHKVAVFPHVDIDDDFFALPHIQFVEIRDLNQAIVSVTRHQFDLLIDVNNGRYWVNDSSAPGYIAERLFLGATNGVYEKQAVSGRAIRYIDWVIPGVLGMNMMFSCLFGVGYVIVRYRKSGVLKRLKATPLGAFEFLSAQVVSRLWLVMAITAFVFFSTHILLKFVMNGSYVSLFVVLTLGAVCLINLGLLIATRTASEELAGGVLNLCSWPMMFLSGVWFSLEGTHPVVRGIAQLLPLTHVIDASRAIMIDGASLIDVVWHLAYLGVLSIVLLGAGAMLFKWE